MKRALAITLTVAMIGGLMFMGFAGSAAAQETVEGPVQVQETGDASVDIGIDQANNNAQLGYAESGDAVALSDGGADAAQPVAAHDKGGTAAAAGAGGGAMAASVAENTQVQNVDQANHANVENVTAASGDTTGDQTIGEDPELAERVDELEERVDDLEEGQAEQQDQIDELGEQQQATQDQLDTLEGNIDGFIQGLYDDEILNPDENPWPPENNNDG